MDKATRDRLSTADAEARQERNELRTDYFIEWENPEERRSRTIYQEEVLARAMEDRGFRKVGVIEVEGVKCWNTEYPRDSREPRPTLRLIDRMENACAIQVSTSEERAIAAVSRVGARMRFEAEKVATTRDDDNER